MHRRWTSNTGRYKHRLSAFCWPQRLCRKLFNALSLLYRCPHTIKINRFEYCSTHSSSLFALLFLMLRFEKHRVRFNWQPFNSHTLLIQAVSVGRHHYWRDSESGGRETSVWGKSNGKHFDCRWLFEVVFIHWFDTSMATKHMRKSASSK